MARTPTCIGTNEFQLQPVKSDDVGQNNNMDSPGNDTEDISQLANIILPDNEESNDAQDIEIIELQNNEDLRKTSSDHLKIELSRNEETNNSRRRPLIEDNESNRGKKRKMSHPSKTDSIDQLIVNDAGGNLNNYRPVKRRKPQCPTKVKHLPNGTVVRFLHEPELHLNQEEKRMRDKAMKLIPTEELHSAQNSLSSTHSSSSSDHASTSFSSHGPNQKKNTPGLVDPEIQDDLNVRPSNNHIPQRTRNSKCTIRPSNPEHRILHNSDTNTREEQEVPVIEAPDISESSMKLQEGVLNMSPQGGNITSHINSDVQGMPNIFVPNHNPILEPQIDLDSPSGGIPMPCTQYNVQPRLCPIPHALCVMREPHAHFQFCVRHNLWHTYELKGGPDFSRPIQEQQSDDEEPEVSENSVNESQHLPAVITNQTQQRILNDQQQQQSRSQRNDDLQLESIYMDIIEHISKLNACDDQSLPRPLNVQENHQQNPVLRLSESHDNNASLHLPKNPLCNNQPQQRGFNVQQRQPQSSNHLVPVSINIGNGRYIPATAVYDGPSQLRLVKDPQIAVNPQSGLQNAFLNSQSQQRVLNVKKQQLQSCGNVQLESGYVANTQPIQKQPQPGPSIVQQRVTEMPAHTESELRDANNESLDGPREALRSNLPQQRMLNVQQLHPQCRGNQQSESSNDANNNDSQLIHEQPHPQLSIVQQRVTEIPAHTESELRDANNESLDGPREALRSNLPQQRMLNVQQLHPQCRGNRQSESSNDANNNDSQLIHEQPHPQLSIVQQRVTEIPVHTESELQDANNESLEGQREALRGNLPQQIMLNVQQHHSQCRGNGQSESSNKANNNNSQLIHEQPHPQLSIVQQRVTEIPVHNKLESFDANNESLHGPTSVVEALRSNLPQQRMLNVQQQHYQSRGNGQSESGFTVNRQLFSTLSTRDRQLHPQSLKVQEQHRRILVNRQTEPEFANNAILHAATNDFHTNPPHQQVLKVQHQLPQSRGLLQSESDCTLNSQRVPTLAERDGQPRPLNVQHGQILVNRQLESQYANKESLHATTNVLLSNQPRQQVVNDQKWQPQSRMPFQQEYTLLDNVSKHFPTRAVHDNQRQQQVINNEMYDTRPQVPSMTLGDLHNQCMVQGALSSLNSLLYLNIEASDFDQIISAVMTWFLRFVQQEHRRGQQQQERQRRQRTNVENQPNNASNEVPVDQVTQTTQTICTYPRRVQGLRNNLQFVSNSAPNDQSNQVCLESDKGEQTQRQLINVQRPVINDHSRLPIISPHQEQQPKCSYPISKHLNSSNILNSRWTQILEQPINSVCHSINSGEPPINTPVDPVGHISINLAQPPINIQSRPPTPSRDDVNIKPRASVAQSINTQQSSAYILPQVENRQGQERNIKIRNSSEVNVPSLRDDLKIGPRAFVAHRINTPQSSADILPQVENRQGQGRSIKIRHSSEVNVQPSISRPDDVNIEPRASVAQRINIQQRHVACLHRRRKPRPKRERLYLSD